MAPPTPISREEYVARMVAGRQRAKEMREQGLLPPRKKRTTRPAPSGPQSIAAEAPLHDEDTTWMIDAETEMRGLGQKLAVTPLTETAEFSDAVAKAVASALESKTQEIIERLAAQRQAFGGPGGQAPGPAAEAGFARILAAQLAELIDQDRRTRGQAARLPADEIEARRDAGEMLEQLLTDAFAQQSEPRYNVMRPLYIEEQLVDATWQNPATKVLMRRQIVWYGIPNEFMSPDNPPAEAISAAFLRTIGGQTRPINRPDLGRPKMRVLGSSEVSDTPAVGTPKNIGMLKLIGDTVAGQITVTNVLGTVAAPARQLV